MRSSSTTARAGNKWWKLREIRKAPRDNKQRKVVSCSRRRKRQEERERERDSENGGRRGGRGGRETSPQFPFKLMQTVPAVAAKKRRISPTFFSLRAAAMMNICVTPFFETERRNESARFVYVKSPQERSHFSREFCITRLARGKTK